MASSWRDALLRLHVAGWDTDDIDAACEALVSACEEGPYAGAEVTELTAAQVREVLETEVADEEVPALRTIAALRAMEGAEARQLREALYDLDAFAYAYGGVD